MKRKKKLLALLLSAAMAVGSFGMPVFADVGAGVSSGAAQDYKWSFEDGTPLPFTLVDGDIGSQPFIAMWDYCRNQYDKSETVKKAYASNKDGTYYISTLNEPLKGQNYDYPKCSESFKGTLRSPVVSLASDTVSIKLSGGSGNYFRIVNASDGTVLATQNAPGAFKPAGGSQTTGFIFRDYTLNIPAASYTDGMEVYFELVDNTTSSYGFVQLDDVKFRAYSVAEVTGVTKYAVSANSTGNGTLSVNTESTVKNGAVQIAVTPNEGAELLSLTVTAADNSIVDMGTKTLAFNMPGQDVTITAVFSTDIKEFDAIPAVRYTIGEAGNPLPEKVAVTYSDDVKGNVDVTWDAATYSLDRAGTYNVTGTVGGTSLKPTFQLTVYEPAEGNYILGGAFALNEGSETEGTYTASVKLNGISAVAGTFGIQYDSAIMKVKQGGTAYWNGATGSGVTMPSGSNYMILGWMSGEEPGRPPVDASAAPVEIMSVAFDMTKADYDRLFCRDSLRVYSYEGTDTSIWHNGGYLIDSGTAYAFASQNTVSYERMDRYLTEITALPGAVVTINGVSATANAQGKVLFALADGVTAYQAQKTGYLLASGTFTAAAGTAQTIPMKEDQGVVSYKWSFEDGTPLPFTLVDGDVSAYPFISTWDYCRNERKSSAEIQEIYNINKDGTYYLSTLQELIANQNTAAAADKYNEAFKGTLRSPKVSLASDTVAFKLSGGTANYFRIVDAATGTELARQNARGTSKPAGGSRATANIFHDELLTIPADKYQDGMEVYFELVDAATASYGYVQLDDVRFSAYSVEEPPAMDRYSISVDAQGAGTVTLNTESTIQNGFVQVTAVPNEGAELKTLEVTAEDGSAVAIGAAGHAFAMPAQNVTVSAVFVDGYGIGLESSGVTLTSGAVALSLGTAAEGYTSAESATITVSNSGTGKVTGLKAALSGAGANSFTLGTLSANEIAQGASATFTVEPKPSLAVGTHRATVTVTADNGVTESFDVTFEVTAKAAGVTVSGAFSFNGGAVPQISDLVSGISHKVGDAEVTKEGHRISAASGEENNQKYVSVSIRKNGETKDALSIKIYDTTAGQTLDMSQIIVKISAESITSKQVNYELMNMAPGTYKIVAAKKNHTPAVQIVTVTDQDVAIKEIAVTYAGDINGDTYINDSDYNLLMTMYGKESESYDLTGDSRINDSDYNLLMTRYGK
ncbi:InlB B-repeat-containing protein [Bacilliculturomica massiliensis]|uniref:InlB B-repeat-containing protein n=1 Tax=Bacilliculturomica massiliensis TaxID=1917867 RepID=UPI001030883F|nr:Ig-like domain-containing protein [Bacilliculturomica massiliensis]